MHIRSKRLAHAQAFSQTTRGKVLESKTRRCWSPHFSVRLDAPQRAARYEGSALFEGITTEKRLCAWLENFKDSDVALFGWYQSLLGWIHRSHGNQKDMLGALKMFTETVYTGRGSIHFFYANVAPGQ